MHINATADIRWYSLQPACPRDLDADIQKQFAAFASEPQPDWLLEETA
jgi:hypothetical protein